MVDRQVGWPWRNLFGDYIDATGCAKNNNSVIVFLKDNRFFFLCSKKTARNDGI
jgi:hypothetical protein